VLGTKVAIAALTGSKERVSLGYDARAARHAAAASPASPAALLLVRGDAAVTRIASLTEAPGDPWRPTGLRRRRRVGAVADRAA
jgi:hypothetical protein